MQFFEIRTSRAKKGKTEDEKKKGHAREKSPIPFVWENKQPGLGWGWGKGFRRPVPVGNGPPRAGRPPRLLIGGWPLGRPQGFRQKPRARPTPPPKWDVSLSDFFLFVWLVIVGGLVGQYAISLYFKSHPFDVPHKLILGTTALHGGMLLGMAGFRFTFGRLQPRLRFVLPEALRSGVATFLLTLPVVTAVSLLWQGALKLCHITPTPQESIELLRHTDSLAFRITPAGRRDLGRTDQRRAAFPGRHLSVRAHPPAALDRFAAAGGAVRRAPSRYRKLCAARRARSGVFPGLRTDGQHWHNHRGPRVVQLECHPAGPRGRGYLIGSPCIPSPKISRSRSRLGERRNCSRPSAGGSAPRRPVRPSASATTAPCCPPSAVASSSPWIPSSTAAISTTPYRPGPLAKLLKRNLSDLAAMGGRPTAAVLALTLDARVSRKWLEQFYRGLAACARRYRIAIVGGDVAQADRIVAASLTLLGRPAGRASSPAPGHASAIGFMSQACSVAASAAGITIASPRAWPKGPGSPGSQVSAP